MIKRASLQSGYNKPEQLPGHVNPALARTGRKGDYFAFAKGLCGIDASKARLDVAVIQAGNPRSAAQ